VSSIEALLSGLKYVKYIEFSFSDFKPSAKGMFSEFRARDAWLERASSKVRRRTEVADILYDASRSYRDRGGS